MIADQHRRLVVCVLEAVWAQTCFVDNGIRDVLGVMDGGTRVVHSLVTFTVGRMHAELDLVDAVGEAEDWEVSSLDSRDSLISLGVNRSSLVVSGNWDEVSELLGGAEVIQLHAFIELVVEGDLIKGLLQVPSTHLIIHEGLLWQQMQVLLKRFTDEVSLQSLEDGELRGLTLEEGKHAPRDTDDWEVLLFIQVLVRGESQDVPHGLQVLLTLKALFGITRDVYAIDTGELSPELAARQIEVQRNNSCATCLKELGVRCFKEALVCCLQVPVPLVWQWLS